MKTTLVALALLLATTAAAQTQTTQTTTTTTQATTTKQPMTAAQTFDSIVAKGGLAPQDLTFLYLTDKVSPTTVVHTDATVAPSSVNSGYVAAADATRTDVQLGAASNTTGATSVIDKPGAADLLALALERGAVDSESNGTAVTLSTTPYLLAGFIGLRDSPANWKDYATLRHIALSASFANQTAVDAGDFSSVQSGQVKWTILGNRSPRDAALVQSFLNVASQPVQSADDVKNTACSSLTATYLTQIGQVATALQSHPTAASLRSTLDGIFATTTFTADQEAQIGACGSATVDAEIRADGAAAQLNAMTQAYLALNTNKQLSLAAGSTRDATIDDYATIKVLYGYDSAPKITVNLNAEGNFNQHYQHKNLSQVRSFAVELGSTFGRFNGNRFDATLAAKIWRNQDSANQNVSVVQIKGNIYLTDLYVLPVSISYATEAQDNIKKGFQINIGLASLFDSYLARPLGSSQ
jgi:hypothetical protein